MSEAPRPSVLVVDDRPANLLAIEAALEALDIDIVRANSGPEALKALLHGQFAAILLDVQMPGMDGFETAEVIKRRERTRTVPIIFLTAISKEQRHVFAGYEAGAIDYIFKPVDPEILRSKVAVLIELWISHQRVAEQQQQLAANEKERELEEERRAGERRYRTLADAMPQIVYTATADGAIDYFNHRWVEYTGLPLERTIGWQWDVVIHPEDLEASVTAWRDAVSIGSPHEIEQRVRRHDGSYRWHLLRAVPLSGEDGSISSWAGTLTDIDEHKRTQTIERFLGEATAVLSSGSSDIDEMLGEIAGLAVGRLADVVALDVLSADGSRVETSRVAGDKSLSSKDVLQLRSGEHRDALPPSARHVLETGHTAQAAAVDGPLIDAWTSSKQQAKAWRRIGVAGALCVPLQVRGQALGTLTALRCQEPFDDRDINWGQTLAGRIAAAIDTVRLHDEVARRARAAQVLDAIGDGVLLLDQNGRVRLWNPAAEAITGIAADAVLGNKATEAIPGWDHLVERVPVTEPSTPTRPETVPFDLEDRELWLAISGVGFAGGTVYAFRDLTESRRLEKMKSDFIATVSHELRTPLAAVYGAAKTLRRTDMPLGDDIRDQLTDMISEQSERLAAIVDDVLLASRLDAGNQALASAPVDAAAVVTEVSEAARIHAPEGIDLQVTAEELHVEADPQYLRQVLANLVDNAIKYSPDGGAVEVTVELAGQMGRLAVRDHGIGIPATERGRVFEKFYRLDPDMTRGIGGTGLGLYICRELVRRMRGRIWVDGADPGSRFVVELPLVTPAPAAGDDAPAAAAASSR